MSDHAGVRARVALVSLGGTIDSLGGSRLDLGQYTEERRRLPEGAMLDELPELRELAELEPVPFPRTPSHAIDGGTWLRLASTVQEVSARADVDGVVITHGTNTLEETAYLLHLTVEPRVPVVVTGAMRPWNVLGSDGPLNLWQSVRLVTALPRHAGVSVCLDGRAWHPRDVSKQDTYRVTAIGSRLAGPVATVEADGSAIVRGRPPVGLAGRFKDTAREVLPRVDVVTTHIGADGALIDASVDAGAAGLVVAGAGPGAVTPAQDEALDRAVARGVAVCVGTRVASGLVPARPSLLRRGIFTAGGLTPWQARVLLALALTTGARDAMDLQALFGHELEGTSDAAHPPRG